MHQERIDLWQHTHRFNTDKTAAERRTLVVVIITLLMMGLEIVVGLLTNSMALYADGWHMGTHAFGLGVSLLAYILARRLAHDKRFVFGAWKIEVLGAFSSAIILGIVGLSMAGTSIERLLNPLPITFQDAIFVAILGLVVNAGCAVILSSGGGHTHGIGHSHGHAHDHDHDHEHEDSAEHDHHDSTDLNLKSATLHVVADAVTSVLAILALLGVGYLGWNWLDPAMGIVGAFMIVRWSVLLLKDTSGILLERNDNTDASAVADVTRRIEADGDTKICDLHLWKVSQDKYACIVSLVTSKHCVAEDYKRRLYGRADLAHVTIEVLHCSDSA